jgi:hypothetical protein
VIYKTARPRYSAVWVKNLEFRVGDLFGGMENTDKLFMRAVVDVSYSGFQATHLLLRDQDYTRFVRESRWAEIATGEVRALGMRVLGGYPMSRIIGVSERYWIWT